MQPRPSLGCPAQRHRLAPSTRGGQARVCGRASASAAVSYKGPHGAPEPPPEHGSRKGSRVHDGRGCLTHPHVRISAQTPRTPQNQDRQETALSRTAWACPGQSPTSACGRLRPAGRTVRVSPAYSPPGLPSPPRRNTCTASSSEGQVGRLVTRPSLTDTSGLAQGHNGRPRRGRGAVPATF